MIKISFICSDALYDKSQGAPWPSDEINYIFESDLVGTQQEG